jgi:hypothetical protein
MSGEMRKKVNDEIKKEQSKEALLYFPVSIINECFTKINF